MMQNGEVKTLKNRNICKFVSEESQEELSATQFIYETALPDGGMTYIALRNRVILVTEGKGKCHVENHKTYTLATGILLFLFTGQQFRMEDDGGLKFLYMDFSGNRVPRLFSRFGITEDSNVFPGMDCLIPLWKEGLVSASGENLDLLCQSMLLYGFSKLRTQEKKHSDTVTLITEYMEDHFTENTCTLQQMSADLGYNAKYLSHLIKEELGVGFSEHLTDLRVRYAILLMHQGVTSIKNISILSGFTDPLYFSKVFRRRFGVSPSDYATQNLT